MEGFPGGGEFRGRDASAAFVHEFAEAWESARYEYERARIVDGHVVHMARWVVAGKSSGDETRLEFFGSVRMEGPLLAEMILFWTEEEALAYARGS